MRASRRSCIREIFVDGESPWEFLLPCAGCSHDQDAKQVVVLLDHLSEFSLAARFERLFLQLVIQ